MFLCCYFPEVSVAKEIAGFYDFVVNLDSFFKFLVIAPKLIGAGFDIHVVQEQLFAEIVFAFLGGET